MSGEAVLGLVILVTTRSPVSKSVDDLVRTLFHRQLLVHDHLIDNLENQKKVKNDDEGFYEHNFMKRY